MTVLDAITQVQGSPAGFINRRSAKYAQTLLMPQETITAAVVANIRTRRDKYPGVVVLTDTRLLAVCGIPGIRRAVILAISALEKCEESSTVIQYKATFLTRKDAFTMVVDPDVGEKFSAYIAEMNGEQFEDIKIRVDGNILNPNLLRERERNRLRKERSRARAVAEQITRQQAAEARFHAAAQDVEKSGKEAAGEQHV